MTLEEIRKFKMEERTFKPDWDDVCIEFTLPCGVELNCLTVCNNEVVEDLSLEGLDSWIYFDEIEELETIHKLTLEQLFDYLEQLDSDFDRTEFE